MVSTVYKGLTVFIVLCIAYAVDYIRKYSSVSPISYTFFSPLSETDIHRSTGKRLIRLDTDRDAVAVLLDSYGAESFAEDPLTGEIYTGLSNGSLQRLRLGVSLDGTISMEAVDLLRANITDVGNGDRCSKQPPADECGRFLGLKILHPKGGNATLIGCEKLRGLVQIKNIDQITPDSPKPIIQVLTSEVTENDKIIYCNSVAISPDGSVVYFTESSKRTLPEFMYDVLDGRRSGRLLRYDIKADTTSILRDHIAFANGLVLTHEGDAVLVAEMMRGLVWRYQLSRDIPDAEKWTVFCGLPFLPDNIQQLPDTEDYLVSGFVWLNPLVKSCLSSWPLLRKALGVLSPDHLQTVLSMMHVVQGNVGVVARVNKTGGVSHIVDGAAAGARKTSEVFETSGVENLLLWGSFSHDVPLIASRSMERILENEEQGQRERMEVDASEKDQEDQSFSSSRTIDDRDDSAVLEDMHE